MLKTRIILILASGLTVWLIFLLPKSVVENEANLNEGKSSPSTDALHNTVDASLQNQINTLKVRLSTETDKRNSSIFADSLANLYNKATRYDSAALFAEKANTFFESPESILKTGEAFFQAFSFAMESSKRKKLALKAREYFQNILNANSHQLDVKTKMALTFFGTGEPPMQGVNMLREVLAEDPKFKPALFNMGMLSVQSQQFGKAIDWLNQLLAINPDDVQAVLLLGVAYAGNKEKDKAREQFEKAKKLDADPAVQQQANAYLKDLQ